MKGQGDGAGAGTLFYEKLLILNYKDSRMYGELGLGPLRPYGVWRDPTARPSAKQRYKKLQKKR